MEDFVKLELTHHHLEVLQLHVPSVEESYEANKQPGVALKLCVTEGNVPHHVREERADELGGLRGYHVRF